MMTQQLEVSILAAPLAAIDRRVLSEAWYSALRLVCQPRQTSAIAPLARSPVAQCVRAYTRNVQERSWRDRVEMRRFHTLPTKPSTTCGDEVRTNISGRRCALARRIERAFAQPNSHAKRATFSMGRGNARVHIILQTKGECTALLAICRPELRHVVARALAQARLALAARGIGIELRGSGAGECS